MYKIERHIQITLSEGCNLNCGYCYEKNKSQKVLDFELAKSIIISEFNSAIRAGCKAVLLYFHGGEICLHFERLKEICEWLWDNEWNIKYRCAATTNGTLIHGYIKDWFKVNAHRFELGLSLDGNREMHNINRSGSYDRIDKEFFKSTYPNLCIKMTVSPQTITSLSSGIIDIVSNGFKLSANLAYGCNWSDETLKYTFAEEMKKLVVFFIEHPEYEPPLNLLQKNLIPFGRCIYTKEKIRPIKYCGAGSGMCCYDMEGNKYPCQMFMPSSSTKYFGKDTIALDDIIFDSDCKECTLISLCSTCIGFAFIEHGRLIKTPGEMCDYRKIEILCYSKLLFEMLKNKDDYNITRKMTETEVALAKVAITHIQNVLRQPKLLKYFYT